MSTNIPTIAISRNTQARKSATRRGAAIIEAAMATPLLLLMACGPMGLSS